MKIAEVSKRYGVSTDTLRYYERIGLLRHVPRNKSGIRDYDEASCNAVEFVKCMRDAGMSIESLVEYMELLEQGDETTAARKELLLRQGDEIRERIAGLERALARLEYKIEHYDEVMTATERTLRGGGSNRRECVCSVGVALESFIGADSNIYHGFPRNQLRTSEGVRRKAGWPWPFTRARILRVFAAEPRSRGPTTTVRCDRAPAR